jgi:hypothetical protein
MTTPDEAAADWPFDQAPNVAALTVRSVLEGAPVLMVSHDADDAGWQFLDGRPPEVDEGRIVAMRSIIERDPGLRDLADLEIGWIAWRQDAGSPWIRERNPRSVAEEEARRRSLGGRVRRLLGRA